MPDPKCGVKEQSGKAHPVAVAQQQVVCSTAFDPVGVHRKEGSMATVEQERDSEREAPSVSDQSPSVCQHVEQADRHDNAEQHRGHDHDREHHQAPLPLQRQGSTGRARTPPQGQTPCRPFGAGAPNHAEGDAGAERLHRRQERPGHREQRDVPHQGGQPQRVGEHVP